MALPIPEAAPVMKMTFPFSESVMVSWTAAGSVEPSESVFVARISLGRLVLVVWTVDVLWLNDDEVLVKQVGDPHDIH